MAINKKNVPVILNAILILKCTPKFAAEKAVT
jgi:hypothetical protein